MSSILPTTPIGASRTPSSPTWPPGRGGGSTSPAALVVGRGLLLIAVATVAGLAGAIALTRVMSSLVFGITATDPLTFVLTAGTLAGVALLACYVPARRATRVDPTVALRGE